MKKRIIFLIAGVIAISASFTSCSSESKSSNTSSSVADTNSNSIETAENPLELLNTVWESYNDDELFPAAGGDFSEENNNMSGPGKYALDDTQALDASFGIPETSVSKVEDAASLMHMMNANTFTCCVLDIKDGESVDEVINEIHENLLNRQWICGMPDRLEIYKLSNYVITVFGENDIMNTFGKKLKNAYSDVELSTSDNIIA